MISNRSRICNCSCTCNYNHTVIVDVLNADPQSESAGVGAIAHVAYLQEETLWRRGRAGRRCGAAGTRRALVREAGREQLGDLFAVHAAHEEQTAVVLREHEALAHAHEVLAVHQKLEAAGGAARAGGGGAERRGGRRRGR